MESFGKLLRKFRTEKRITLQELRKKVDLSIGYLSDIEHSRRNPPDINSIVKIEDALGITDGSLVDIARKMKKATADFSEKIRVKPKLAELMLRAENLSDDQLSKIIENID